MTDKQYKCLNGDLIEVGKLYINEEGKRLEVIAIHNDDIVVLDGDEYLGYFSYELISLWQEQPDQDGWIKHTTGKQPVADDVLVRVKLGEDSFDVDRADGWGGYWKNGRITHYRIVEDKQESEESFKEFFDKDCLDLDPCLYKTSAIDEKINFLVANISEYLQKKGI
jgi:hypothetical protein